MRFLKIFLVFLVSCLFFMGLSFGETVTAEAILADSSVAAEAILADSPASAEADTFADGLVRRADKVRNPDQSFRKQTVLIEYRSGKEEQRMRFFVYSKPNDKTAEYSTLIRFVDPQKDKDKLMLKEGANIWFFDPVSKSSARISPQQRLMGQTSNGDVMTINLGYDYSAKIIKEEELINADKQKVDCYMLELKAKDSGANYYRIEYWVEKETSHPVRGNYYTASDRLSKIIFFRSYREELGKLRPTEAIIIDGVDRNFVTRMIFSNYSYVELKDEVFQRSMLPYFNLD